MNKKLVIVVNDLKYFFSHRIAIAQKAKKIGYQVTIIYGSNNNKKLFNKNLNFNYYYIPMVRGSMNLLKEIKSIYLLFNYFKKNKPDLLHLVTLKPCLYVGFVARILKMENILFAFAGLGIVFNSSKLKFKLIKFFLILMFKYIFKNKNYLTLYQNKNDRDIFINLNLVTKNKTRLIKGSGVNINLFKITNEPQEDTIVVTFVSRLLYDKGITYFISAAKKLLEKKVNIKFLVAGSIDNGNPNSIRKETIDKWKEIKNVNFLGDVSNIFDVYKRSHIVCLPSFYGEGLPKVLIETASSGRAIITTDHPGCRDAIIPNKTGILVPIKDPEKLANKIEYLAFNHDIRKSMGIEGRKLAENQFSINYVVDQHLKIYDYILNKKKIF